MPLLLLKTKGRSKKRFNSSRDLNIIPSILAFIPPKGEEKGDCILNSKYFNPVPFTISLKAMGYRSISTCDFIRLRLSSTLRGGRTPDLIPFLFAGVLTVLC